MSSRSISIPPNPSARLGARRAAARALVSDLGLEEEAQPLAPVPAKRPAVPVRSGPTHRYRVGEHLRMGGGGYSVARAASACKVLALLPYEGRGALLYRVRSDTEAFERVVAEADLTRG